MPIMLTRLLIKKFINTKSPEINFNSAEVYFWPAGEVEECFNLFDLRGGNDFEHAVQVSGLKSKNDITVVTVSTAGKIRVKNE